MKTAGFFFELLRHNVVRAGALYAAWANRDPGISFLQFDAYLEPYRHDLRFAAFARKVGSPAAAPDAAVSLPEKVN